MTDKEVEEMFYVEEENFLEELKNGKYVQLNEEGIDKVVKIIEKYEHIVNEFDKWLLGEKMMFYKGNDGETLIRYNETKNKWLELKGDK